MDNNEKACENYRKQTAKENDQLTKSTLINLNTILFFASKTFDDGRAFIVEVEFEPR